ncbi:MAG TPA: hypothetical protein VFB58_13690 [Chloroflexota bacterium]|nr:hypothetical protein [Chloroflexota bacterium]
MARSIRWYAVFVASALVAVAGIVLAAALITPPRTACACGIAPGPNQAYVGQTVPLPGGLTITLISLRRNRQGHVVTLRTTWVVKNRAAGSRALALTISALPQATGRSVHRTFRGRLRRDGHSTIVLRTRVPAEPLQSVVFTARSGSSTVVWSQPT